MNIITRAFDVGREAVLRKGMDLAPSRGVTTFGGAGAAFTDDEYRRNASAGARKNAAVAACIAAHCFAFPEPPLLVYAQGAPVDLATAPATSEAARLQRLLNRPNPWMSQSDLMQRAIAAMLIGGNAYIHKRRNDAKDVEALYVYSDLHMTPIPGVKKIHADAKGRTPWIAHYEYSADGSQKPVVIPCDDVIHLRWPVVDPDAPHKGLAPLAPLALDVQMANELTRYIWALLKNDGTPLSIVRLPEDLSDEAYRQAKGDWQARQTGSGRGQTAFLRGSDVSVERLGASLDELAGRALYEVPEAHIAANLRVPPIIAGLNVGLTEGREGNYESTRRMWTEMTEVPLWIQVADTIDVALTADGLERKADFDPSLTIRFDIDQVRALRSDREKDAKIATEGFESGAITRDEARAILGLPPAATGGDAYGQRRSTGNAGSTTPPAKPDTTNDTP